jgi:large subunit ribosomal protein L25
MELIIANVYEPSALQAANEAAGGEAEEEVEVPVEGEEETAEGEQIAESETPTEQ